MLCECIIYLVQNKYMPVHANKLECMSTKREEVMKMTFVQGTVRDNAVILFDVFCRVAFIYSFEHRPRCSEKGLIL